MFTYTLWNGFQNRTFYAGVRHSIWKVAEKRVTIENNNLLKCNVNFCSAFARSDVFALSSTLIEIYVVVLLLSVT